MRPVQNLGALSPGGSYAQTRCAQCGKKFTMRCERRVYPFYVGDGYSGKYYFCGWTCMRAWEREHPKKENIWLDYLS